MASSNGIPASATAVRAATGELPILDRAAMLETVENDLELLHQLIEIFLAESSALLAQLRAALRERKREPAERTAHTLKGSVSNFGARRAAAAARAIEDEARENRLDEAERLLPALESEIAQVCQALSQFLSESAA